MRRAERLSLDLENLAMAGRDQVPRGGVVRDDAVRLATIEKVRTWANANGFVAGDHVESPITGPAGNVEYLLLLRTQNAPASETPA